MCTNENNNLTSLTKVYKHLIKVSKEIAKSPVIKNLTNPNSEINIKLREFTNSIQGTMKSIYNMLPPIIDSAKQFQDEILKSYQQIDFEELSNKLNNIYASTYSYDLGETFYDDVNKCVNTFNSNPQNYNINDYKEIEKTIKELTKNYTNLTSITSNANLEYYKTLGNITFVVIIFSIIYFIISNPIMFNLTSEDMANLIDIISTIVNFLSLFK